MSLSLALGAILFCGAVSGIDVKLIDFSNKPDVFVRIITDLAAGRYSSLPGDRTELTKFIYGYLYEVTTKDPEQVKNVQKQLGVLVGPFQAPNPKYNLTTQLIQRLLGPNSGAAIYSHLTPKRVNLWLSAIALYAYDKTLIDPAEFILSMKLSDETINNLLSITPAAFEGTIFEVMAQKALGENATVKEWLEPMVKKHGASAATFKEFASGLDVITSN